MPLAQVRGVAVLRALRVECDTELFEKHLEPPDKHLLAGQLAVFKLLPMADVYAPERGEHIVRGVYVPLAQHGGDRRHLLPVKVEKCIVKIHKNYGFCRCHRVLLIYSHQCRGS